MNKQKQDVLAIIILSITALIINLIADNNEYYHIVTHILLIYVIIRGPYE